MESLQQEDEILFEEMVLRKKNINKDLKQQELVAKQKESIIINNDAFSC